MQAQYVFLPSRETGPISVVRCVHYPVHAHVGVLLLFSVALFEAGSHWTGNLLFLLHWLESQWAPPVTIPQHWEYRCTPVGFLQQALCPLSQFPSLSACLLTYSCLHHTPEAFTLLCFWFPTMFFFFFTVKHSSQPADPWEFPRLLTYKGQNYFCNNTKTLFSLVRWHLHWLSKWTDG